MKKNLSALLLLISLNFSLYAQDELFKVLINKGKNVVDHSKPIFTGSKIYKGQVITVAAGGYVGLIYKNGRSMELKAPGDYPVDNLEKNAIASSGTISKKYADLVVNEMTKTSQGITDDKKKNMGVTGSVDRGPGEIFIYAPKNSDLLGTRVNVKWKRDSSVNEYVVRFKDMFDEPLKSYNTKDTFLIINVSELELKTPSKSFIVWVEPKAGPKPGTTPSGKLVRILEGKKAQDIYNELANIKGEASEETALNKLIMASFCEQHKLFLEAVHYYDQAMLLAPDVEDYRKAYDSFLLRHEIVFSKVK